MLAIELIRGISEMPARVAIFASLLFELQSFRAVGAQNSEKNGV